MLCFGQISKTRRDFQHGEFGLQTLKFNSYLIRKQIYNLFRLFAWWEDRINYIFCIIIRRTIILRILFLKLKPQKHLLIATIKIATFYHYLQFLATHWKLYSITVFFLVRSFSYRTSWLLWRTVGCSNLNANKVPTDAYLLYYSYEWTLVVGICI